MGSVGSTPPGIDCGTDCVEAYAVTRAPPPTITLTAVPRSDSAFAGWSGPADCQDGVVTVGTDLTCTATFTRLPLGQSGAAAPNTRAMLGASLALNGDIFGDVLVYGTTSGAWSREVGDGAGGLVRERADRWSPDWVVRAARLDGDSLTDVVLYNPVTGDWYRATTVGPGDFSYVRGRWDPNWETYPVELDGDGKSRPPTSTTTVVRTCSCTTP